MQKPFHQTRPFSGLAQSSQFMRILRKHLRLGQRLTSMTNFLNYSRYLKMFGNVVHISCFALDTVEVSWILTCMPFFCDQLIKV